MYKKLTDTNTQYAYNFFVSIIMIVNLIELCCRCIKTDFLEPGVILAVYQYLNVNSTRTCYRNYV